MRFVMNILDYLGKYQDGVLIMLSIKYDDIYYDATYFYNKDHLVLTVCEELENTLGHPISDDDGYVDLIKTIISKSVPYEEIYNRLDDFVPNENSPI